MTRLVAALILLLVPLVDPAHLHAQATTTTSLCEPGLAKPVDDPLAYGQRGDRCEGIYLQKVAGTGGFSVVAFVAGGQVPDIVAGKPVELQWQSGLDTPVFLRAVSLRRNFYYRMDSQRAAKTTQFKWPTDVLNQLKLKIGEVGIVAWKENRMGDKDQDVYLPIQLGGATTEGQASYVLQVVSGVDLKDLFVRLATADATGREQQVIIKNESLKRGYYPAERPIAIPIALSTLKAPGLYRLQLSAVSFDGHPSSRVLYFQHAAR